jgi:hypothetical protein
MQIDHVKFACRLFSKQIGYFLCGEIRYACSSIGFACRGRRFLFNRTTGYVIIEGVRRLSNAGGIDLLYVQRVWLEDVLVVRQIIEKVEALRITEFKV